MENILALSEKSPTLWAVACELQGELASGAYSNWGALYQRLEFLTEPEWIDSIKTILPGWEKIATQDDGLTAKHTLIVLASCMNLPEYQEAQTQTRREIEWAAVFHDLDKDILYGRGDGAHGFRSAAAAAKCLVGLGFDLNSSDDFENWLVMLKFSQKQAGETWVNDFSHLADITSGLRYFFGVDTPASRILKAVIFHQSLPTIDDWPNPVTVSDGQIRASLTLSDMNVLGPLMLGDSDAWNICEPTRDAYMEELRGNIAKNVKLLSF